MQVKTVSAVHMTKGTPDAVRPQVRTTSGSLAGRHLADGVAAFLGVPYAQAPVGLRRFRPSVPVDPWSGVRDASRFGPAFAQVFDAQESILEELVDEPPATASAWVGSEDALTLNFWAPKSADERRPVIVYIHGGANWLESSRCQVYDGARLAAVGDCVVASLNYRLGLFGFIDLSPLSPDAPIDAHSHGLGDQMLALDWIKANAAAFGGDPDNITLVGESAGSMSISWHIARGALEGVVRRVVMKSGVGSVSGFGRYPSVTQHSAEEGRRRAENFWHQMGIVSFAQLQELTTGDLLDRHAAITAEQDILFDADTLFYPRTCSVALRDPFDAVSAGAARKLEVMIGFTTYEMGLWLLWDDELDQRDTTWAAAKLPGFPPERRAEVAALYERLFAHETPGVRAMHLLGDALFVMPSLAFAEGQARAGGKAWVYQFNSPANNPRARALHAADQIFFFGTHGTPGGLALMGEPDASATSARDVLSADMMGRLVQFARGEGPGDDWPAFDIPRRATLSFSGPASVQDDLFGQRWSWWRETIIAPELGWLA